MSQSTMWGNEVFQS